MNAARLIRYARRSAGFTQRDLAARTGLPQSTIGRIETGRLQPRWVTMQRLLAASGHSLEISQAGQGIDRSQIRSLRARSPRERLELAAADAAGMDSLLAARRRPPKEG
ncbi:MAG: helix-turn-helix transcriptional regulator [Chloroflexi bacterium]|nr:helix-turn-helix transcriptional regulator [Chloroflexota bacterium]